MLGLSRGHVEKERCRGGRCRLQAAASTASLTDRRAAAGRLEVTWKRLTRGGVGGEGDFAPERDAGELGVRVDTIALYGSTNVQVGQVPATLKENGLGARKCTASSPFHHRTCR